MHVYLHCRWYMLRALSQKFPNPVNETSSRIVAAGVVLLCGMYIVTLSNWVLFFLIYGFAARVVAGPTYSPLALFVTKVITPSLRMQHRYTPGPPKRFAQLIGLLVSSSAGILELTGHNQGALIAICVLVVAATLEAGLGVCLGCVMFKQLMRLNLIPEKICLECADISRK